MIQLFYLAVRYSKLPKPSPAVVASAGQNQNRGKPAEGTTASPKIRAACRRLQRGVRKPGQPVAWCETFPKKQGSLSHGATACPELRAVCRMVRRCK